MILTLIFLLLPPMALAQSPTKAPMQTPTALATPAIAAPMPSADPAPAPSTGYGKTSGFLGPVTLGPTLSIALPHPMNVGLEGRYQDRVGFALTYGFLPELKIPWGDTRARLNSWDLRLRWFPLRGAFFLGAAMGTQRLVGVREDQVLGSPQLTSLEIETTFLSPHLGWRWVGDSGFVWGIDVGWQLALSDSSTFKTSATPAQQAATEFAGLRDDLNRLAADVGSTSLPFLTLLHVGLMF